MKLSRKQFLQSIGIGLPATAIVVAKTGEPKRTVRIPFIKKLEKRAEPGYLYNKAKKDYLAILQVPSLEATPIFGIADMQMGNEEFLITERWILKPTGRRISTGEYEYLLNYIEPSDDMYWSYVSNAWAERLYPVPRDVTKDYETATETIKYMEMHYSES